MKLLLVTPAKSLNKAYLKQSLKRNQIELFKDNLIRLFERIRVEEHEEHLKNIVADFLKDTWYRPAFEINTSKRTDLVIHSGKSSDDPIGVIIETKKPSNRAEMITPERPNAKALHELLHYYMQERYIRDNKEIKHLIICNIYEWYIFDAADFERFFFGNHKLVKSYKDWNDGLLVSANTDWFYQEIARPFIEKELAELPCVCFDLHDFEKIVRHPDKVDDKKLINLYKILSPPHLLKQPFANDSNSLNKEFYSELLHIIGLEEVKEKGKKLIRRKAEGERYDGSLLENTINVLRIRSKVGVEQAASDSPLQSIDLYFETALELCINWLNRLLFLKLLEGQLISYHKGDRAYTFLNSNRIEDFDELNELFFEVLALRVNERSPSVQAKFANIPYLNSSLFEESDLERATIRINELKNRHDLPLYGATVLKGGSGKRLTGNKNTLTYLFEFLDAYDFSTEGSAEIQEQNKTIINASVLGLIFEKINGYKDGSFFTPGFITMYICRETIRRAVLRKFNDKYGWACRDITELYNRIDPGKLKEANETVNSLKICDPAVGSGHFLVSALNEIISVKSDLGILVNKDGKRLREYAVSVENDELIISHDEHLFAYNYKDPESQRVQETFFHEKETIIENCLFGVDINPKSVAICRLRLWIELLKNAYYRPGTDELETLPNIDINIKYGNSLLNRFALKGEANVYATERYKLKALADRYREKVWMYKQAPANKAILRKEIADLKEELQKFAVPTDPDLIALRKLKNDLDQLGLGMVKDEIEQYRALVAEELELKRVVEGKQRTFYANAFEWRFEFPEVLDENGEFSGFDAVIGNPPYIRQEAIKEQKPAFMEMFGDFYCGTADIYTYFYKVGLNILRTGGTLCYISPNKFMRAGYGRNTRELLTNQARPLMLLDFGDLPVFDEATTYPAIVMVEKSSDTVATVGRRKKLSQTAPTPVGSFYAATFTDPEQMIHFAELLPQVGFTMPVSALKAEGWTLERPEVLALMAKLRAHGKPLGEYVDGKFYYGIKTGLNEAFVIDEETRQRLIAEDPKSVEIIKPWLRGRDMRKWEAQWSGLYIIFTRRGTDIDQYPAIKRYLEQFRVDLVPKITGYEEHGRKPGPYKWFEIQDNIAYFAEFETSKIVYPDITKSPKFLWDDSNSYLGNTAYFIPTDEMWLVGLLNSKILWWFYGTITSSIRGGFVRNFSQFLGQLPIPIAVDSQMTLITECVEKILANPDNPDVPRLEAEIDRLVYELYGLTEKEIALVAGK